MFCEIDASGVDMTTATVFFCDRRNINVPRAQRNLDTRVSLLYQHDNFRSFDTL